MVNAQCRLVEEAFGYEISTLNGSKAGCLKLESGVQSIVGPAELEWSSGEVGRVTGTGITSSKSR